MTENRLLSTDRAIAIYYAFPEEIESYKKTNENYCVITFSSAGWKLIETTIGTIKLNENGNSDKGGSSFVSKIDAVIPGHDDNTPSDFSKISGKRVLLRIDYKSGRRKVIGSNISAPKILLGTSTDTSTKRNLQSKFKSTAPNLWLS